MAYRGKKNYRRGSKRGFRGNRNRVKKISTYRVSRGGIRL